MCNDLCLDDKCINYAPVTKVLMCACWLTKEIKRIKEKKELRAGQWSAVEIVNQHVDMKL